MMANPRNGPAAARASQEPAPGSRAGAPEANRQGKKHA
jgi:hypothetical protein